MDLKGLAWIGNIYEKFEAMCLEMEEVMYQDTVKYVENQAQTVGANVKRFYSEVMQDLHPHSCMGPVKPAAAELSLNPHAHPELKRKAIAKKDPRETDGKLVDDSKVISGRSKTGVYKRPVASRKGYSGVNHPPPVCRPISHLSANISSLSLSSQRSGSQDGASAHLDLILPSAGVEGMSVDAKEKISHEAVDTSVSISDASVDSAPSCSISSVVSTGLKKADSRPISSTSLSTDSSGTCANSGDVSQTDQTINGDVSFSKSVVEEVMASHKERLEDSNMDAVKNYDIIDKEVEIEQFNESAWAETCVLVEGEKLHFVPPGTGIHKSYKKKLREAFSTKLRSTRKEYEQLAAKYKERNPNEENADTLIPAQSADLTAKTSPTHSSESEWELL